MNKIEVIKHSANGTTLALIEKILLLRKNNWGMSEPDQCTVERIEENLHANASSQQDYEYIFIIIFPIQTKNKKL